MSGISGDDMEALALLANRANAGWSAGHLPPVTGASEPSVLGAIPANPPQNRS